MALWDFRQDPGGLKTEEILSGQPYPSWRKAEVPGDIAMACPEQPYYEGICWYRREFEVPSGMKGKRIMLHFEAVNHISCIYINSIFAGRNNQGYLPFGMDISKYVTDGNNTLLVMVDNGIMEVVFKDGWISKIMTRSGPLPCDAVAPGSLRFVETVPSKDFLPGWETINESVYTVTGWKMIENGPVRWVCRAEGHVGNAECISNITIHKGTATIDFDINLGGYLAELKRNDIDALVIIPTNWVEPPVLLRHVHDFKHLPLILWGFPETDEYLDKGLFLGSSSAYAVIKGALEQMDIKHECIMGLPSNIETKNRAELVLSNISASIELARSKIGLIGYNSMGIYTATFDQLSIKKHFGVEIDCMADSYIVTEMMNNISDADCMELRERFGCGYVLMPDAEKSFNLPLKMYLTLKKLICEGNWNALSVKCQHEFTSYLGCAACLPLSMLTDEGIMCSDEGDVHAVLTMLIAKTVTEADLFFGDIYPYNHNRFLMGHCGLVPHECGEPGCTITLNEMDKRISRDGLTTGGIVSTLTYRSGDVTLARIEGRRDSGYRMHIAEGRASPARSVGHNFSNVEVELD